MDIPVEFSSSFENYYAKNISGKIPQFDYTLNYLEADVMGTTISYTEPKHAEYDVVNNSDTLWNSKILLKVGDKMYLTDSNGSYSNDDKTIDGNYFSILPTYDIVKNEKNISIVLIFSNKSMEDLDKLNLYDNISNDFSKENTTKDIQNNNLTKDQTNIKNNDKNIEQNGLKVSVNKIIASKHKIRATIYS